MSGIFIEGNTPLIGTVTASGSTNSASKLIFAAMFSNEDVILNNVPRVQSVMDDIEVIESVGGKAEWVGNNTLLVNGSQINSYEVPLEIGEKYRLSSLLAGPLIFRFGKAFIPKYKSVDGRIKPINRFLDTWESLGFDIEEDDYYMKILNNGDAKGSIIKFKNVSHTATDNSLLSSVFLPGESTVINASQDPEVDDLIEFLCGIGAQVTRTENGDITVKGVNIFNGTSFEVCSYKTEIAVFASLAVLTKGNISIKNVKRDLVLQFINFLNKIGVRFEFSGSDLRIWRHDEDLVPQVVEISSPPSFLHDWQPLATLILTQANGESIVHDTVYTDRFGYCLDLNRMGAKIDLVTPSEVGIVPVVNDDTYSIEESGEPLTIAKISGPTKLKGERLTIEDLKNGPVLVLAALCAEGKSEIIGLENVNYYFEDFVDKLKSLGAKIWEQLD